jgi:hypothetical protein
MGEEALVFGPGALIAVGLYLVSMIGVGYYARSKRQGNSMADFYLAGRSLGLTVLFLTLYATQYSGNTLFGYTGKTYRIGFEWTVSILFMFSIIVGYLLFAPRLVQLARKEGFITPGDYISYRFKSKALTLLSTVLMIYALCNYTLAQLKAMGAAVEGITNGAVPSAYGIVALAIIMVIYETLGGMRSVAWTDVIQGVVLLIGFALLVVIVPSQLGGGLDRVVEKLSAMDPPKVQVPDWQGINTWISYVFLLGCGAAIYPQAIQRLYASRSLAVLKRSLMWMSFMPTDYDLDRHGLWLDGHRRPAGFGEGGDRPGIGAGFGADHGPIGNGLLVGCCHFRGGVGGFDVDGRFGASVDLFDVYARYISALYETGQQRRAHDDGGQGLFLGGCCYIGRSGYCHGEDPRASARAKV